MSKFTFKTVFAAALLSVVSPSVSMAQQNNGGQRGPDLSAVASELAVTEAALQDCMPRQERPAQGEAPARPDLDAVAGCLQSAGSSLSTGQILTVLENHRPARPPQQG